MTKAMNAQQPLIGNKAAPLLILLVIGLALLGVFGFSRLYSNNQFHSARNMASKAQGGVTIRDEKQRQEVDLEALLERLSVTDEETRTAAKHKIIQLAGQSQQNRKLVIDTLLGRAEMPAFKFHLDTIQESYFWTSISEIFDELKAVEALDFLIDCLDCSAITGPATNTFHHKPAVRALMGFGELAVPKLSRLLHHPDSLIRYYAAICLGNIGGKEARKAVSEAVIGESDIGVKKVMQQSLAAIDRGQ